MASPNPESRICGRRKPDQQHRENDQALIQHAREPARDAGYSIRHQFFPGSAGGWGIGSAFSLRRDRLLKSRRWLGDRRWRQKPGGPAFLAQALLLLGRQAGIGFPFLLDRLLLL
jgi:hypothetical protein